MRVNGPENNELLRQAEAYQSVKQKNIEDESVKEAQKYQYSQEQKITISNEAKSLHNFIPKMEEIPDIREDKVAELKARIDSGNYEISGEKIAEKMLDKFGI